ncbi:thermosome subunit [Sesbania bispinosa]|nr:thermosome subunit [Sesbania bispinosa]
MEQRRKVAQRRREGGERAVARGRFEQRRFTPVLYGGWWRCARRWPREEYDGDGCGRATATQGKASGGSRRRQRVMAAGTRPHANSSGGGTTAGRRKAAVVLAVAELRQRSRAW